MNKEKQVCWRGFDTTCVCLSFNISRTGQQPMKMHTEVTLLYNTIQTHHVLNCSLLTRGNLAGSWW